MELNFAGLGDLDAIKALMDSASSNELLPVPKSEIREAIVQGRVVWDSGVAIIFNRAKERKYYGIDVGVGSYQVLQLIAQGKGDGSAQKVFEAFAKLVGKPIFLLVISTNARAIKFYKKVGFMEKKTISFKSFKSNLMVR